MSSRADLMMKLLFRSGLSLEETFESLKTREDFLNKIQEHAVKMSEGVECRLMLKDPTISHLCTAIVHGNASKLKAVLDYYEANGYNERDKGRSVLMPVLVLGLVQYRK